jgi:arylsulfatase
MPWAQVGLHPDEDTIADMLKRVGYATGMVGKWHLGHHEDFLPLQQGFDEYLGLPYSNDMWPVDFDGQPVTEGAKADYPPLPLIEGNDPIETVSELDDQAMLTTRYTERAVDFIGRHANTPFFLYVAHSMPHVPLGVSDKFAGASEQGMYGDVIQEIDWSVGQILAALDRFDLAENTLVFFTSDNGPWLNYGNHAGSAGPLREGKGTAFEGGPRVPAIARWPGRIPAGAVTNQLASTIDVLPTLAAITGIDLPDQPIDGVDVLPILAGDTTATPRDRFFYYYGAELRAVRDGKWKRVFEHRTRSYVGVEPGNDGHPGPYAFPTFPTALFDLETDPGETMDLSDAYPDVAARLDALADSVRQSLGDELTGTEGRDVRPPGRRGFNRGDSLPHDGVGATATLSVPPSATYSGNGTGSLTDGRLGSQDIRDGRWLGFQGNDVRVVIDFGSPTPVRRVAVDVLQVQRSWIFFPKSVAFAVSNDGERWATVQEARLYPSREPEPTVRQVQTRVDGLPIRYLRVDLETFGENPDWHSAPGEPSWLFLDEIIVTTGAMGH